MGKTVTDHEFYCTKCGKKGLPVCRDGKMREKGHLKKLFCLNCGCEVNHVECVPGSRYDNKTFFLEYSEGNFGEDGLRIIPLSKWYENHNVDEPEEEEELSVDEWMEIFQMSKQA